MLAPGVSVSKMIASVLKQLYSYQLGFLVSGVIFGSPAIIITTVLWPELLPALVAAAIGFIVAHGAVMFSDVREGRIDPPGEHEFRLSMTELGALVALMSVYISSVFLLGVAADVAAAKVLPAAVVWGAGVTPFLDVLSLRRFGYSPAGIPLLAVLYLLHGLGHLKRVKVDDVARYGQRGRAV